MTQRVTRIITLLVSVLGIFCLMHKTAQAQYFSNHDGFTDSGGYRVQVELTPYLWLPATSGSIGFARSDVAKHISSGSFNTSVPSLSELAQTLHASFTGASIMRYGPYSAEVDLQYISASKSQDLFTRLDGTTFRINTSVSLFRIAPGFGYQVYSGKLAGIPASVDARVGFAYFTTSQTLKGENLLQGRISGRTDFIQPWLGGRLDLIPTPHWRIELGALVQGMGVNGGSWGWGTSLVGSYAFNDTVAFNLGFRALATEREHGHLDTLASGERSLSVVAYGPIAGVSFRF